MKKFGLLILGGFAAVILLANLGPMVGLAISLLILYYAAKEFLKTDSTSGKVIWGIIALIALSASASNFPAVVGLAAIYVLYVVYKKWNEEKSVEQQQDEDPFTSFEKQWAELKRN
ncbi:flagellar basal body rod protein [Pseudalkalibacillus caeni]|uniref:Flagellar basal body rod protein n=1 Tax=Exobacillus caeni TaxID=2574798 RepID=A0A5R9F0J6_9BACL|nr:flagellar basal body rod protein [Pseudalkalibacillus caeni]TLS35956.1 flagellar basal body rod protein [Pseudalkalibacillus caeni]